MLVMVDVGSYLLLWHVVVVRGIAASALRSLGVGSRSGIAVGLLLL